MACSRQRESGDRKRVTGDRKSSRETGDRKRETGDQGKGVGVRRKKGERRWCGTQARLKARAGESGTT